MSTRDRLEGEGEGSTFEFLAPWLVLLVIDHHDLHCQARVCMQ